MKTAETMKQESKQLRDEVVNNKVLEVIEKLQIQVGLGRQQAVFEHNEGPFDYSQEELVVSKLKSLGYHLYYIEWTKGVELKTGPIVVSLEPHQGLKNTKSSELIVL